MLGENHIQIAHMLLGRACSQMELKLYEGAEVSARTALRIVESGSQSYSPSVQQYDFKQDDGDDEKHRILDGGIKRTLKNKVKSNLMGFQQSASEKRYEEEMALRQREVQSIASSKVSGAASSEQLVEMKCSILYIIGQALIERDRLGEARMVFDSALLYATKLNDTTKQLLIHDQLRDIANIVQQKEDRL